MKKSMKLKPLALIPLVLLMAGCVTTGMKQVEKENQENEAKTAAVLEKSFERKSGPEVIKKLNTFYVEKTPLPTMIDSASQLPPVFRTRIDINEQASLPLSEVFVRLSKYPVLGGVKFSVSQDVYEADSDKVGLDLSTSANQDSTSVGKGAGAAAGGNGGVVPVVNTAKTSSSGRRVEVMVSDLISKGGTFAEVLDLIAMKTNLGWRFDGEKVFFYRYESKIFNIDALAGDLLTSATISSTGSSSSSGGGGGGSGGTNVSVGGSTQNKVAMESRTNLWSEVNGALKAQLSPRGKMSLMPSIGQVTITDTPDQLKRIDQYIRVLNKSLGKNVEFNVSIYSVEKSGGDGYGVDWTTVWSTIASKYKLNYSSGGNTSNLGSIASINMINSANGSGNNWAGSSAMIGALSTVGKTTLLTSTSVMASNFIPAPVVVSRERRYLESMETTVSGTAGISQNSLKTGVITTGFNMNITPRVNDAGDILVQLNLDLSDLIDLQTFTSPDGKSAVQLPVKNIRNFMHRVAMKPGQTVVLSGFQQTNNHDEEKGVGSSSFWGLGGSKKTNQTTTSLVILVTPYLVR